MSTVAFSRLQPKPSLFKDVVLPKEHGSWSLAFEPIALGLFIAPSPAGALLAVALSAGFFARRPLRISLHEPRADRRATAQRALILCAVIALLSMTGALLLGGIAWLWWLVPVAIAGQFLRTSIATALDVRRRRRLPARRPS